jgi:prevent-host-death family protein
MVWEMKFVNIRELSRSTSKYVKLANADNEIIITRNGHPYALLSKIKEDDLEDFILAKHFHLEKEFHKARNDFKKGKTKNVRELLNEPSEKRNEIQG